MPKLNVDAARREWEDLAHLDPLWGILTEEGKQFGGWDREEFFASGQREIDVLMTLCGLSAGGDGRAVDFGCGVGRLSKALRSYFGEVYGVDISAEMIKLAREYVPSCTFLLNQTGDLKLFRDNFFDFLYSNVVLQHQPSKEIARSYIREFIRVTKPSGTIVFQMPYKITARHALQPRRRLYSLLRSFGVPANFLYRKLHLNPMRTICLSSDDVKATVELAGARVVRSYQDTSNYHSMTYVLAKADARADPRPVVSSKS